MRDTEIIERIIKNFYEQHRLYLDIHSLSEQTLARVRQSVESSQSADLMDLLEQRKDLMSEVTILDRENKALQKEVSCFLGIEEFTLNKLKGCLEENDLYLQLQEVVDVIAQLLLDISETDRQTQELIRKNWSRPAEISPPEAVVRNTYRSAMEMGRKKLRPR